MRGNGGCHEHVSFLPLISCTRGPFHFEGSALYIQKGGSKARSPPGGRRNPSGYPGENPAQLLPGGSLEFLEERSHLLR